MSSPIINVDELTEGEGRAVVLPGIEKIAVFLVQGSVFVTQDVCSHAKASLSEGWIEGFDVLCPVHEGRFDLRTGAPMCFPVTEPIRTFPNEVKDGVVWADLSGASGSEGEPA